MDAPWYLDVAIISGVVNALFVALMFVWRARVKDLHREIEHEQKRADNLMSALEECYERNGTHPDDPA